MVLIENETTGLFFRFEGKAVGDFATLVLHKGAPAAATTRRPPVESDRQETVLRERCKWFDMWPGTQDAGLHQCRTDDGVALKDVRTSWGSRNSLVAVRLDRKPLDLAKVLPPPEILKRENWRLP